MLFNNIHTFGDVLLLIFAIMIIVGSIMAIFFVLYGALLLILSGGLDEKIKVGVNAIKYSLLGFITLIITIYIFPILGRLLGLNVEKYANPHMILNKIVEISDIILN